MSDYLSNPSSSGSAAGEKLVPKVEIREGLLLFILATIQFTNIMDFVIMMPLGPQLMRVFQINPQQFGLVVSAYTFSAAVSGFCSAFYIDRLDRKKALLGLYLGFAIGTALCALAPTFELLVAARLVAGLFGGVLGALVLAIIGDAIPEERRGAATGKVMAAFSIASIAGIPIGLYLASKTSWHAPFYLLAGMSLVVLAIAMKFLPPLRGHLTNAKHEKPHRVLLNIVKKKNLLWALGMVFILQMAGFTVVPFISPYMVANIGFAESELTFIYLFGGLATVVTSQLAGRLADKYGKKKVYIIAALVSIIPILLITNLPPIPHYQVFIITTFFFIVFGARFVPAMSLITSSVEPKQRGSFMSINSSVQQLASGLAAFTSGLIVQKAANGQLLHFNMVGILASVATVISIFVIMKLKTVS
jgi:predicted MFS family arabinose efflux permease